jgi:hypothetical protein
MVSYPFLIAWMRRSAILLISSSGGVARWMINFEQRGLRSSGLKAGGLTKKQPQILHFVQDDSVFFML